MSVKIKHRRLGGTATVDDRLGAALVKNGTHAYADGEPAHAAPKSEVLNGEGSVGGKKGVAGKRGYNRRDMQAQS